MEQSERSSEISMQELAALVETAGGQAVGMMIQNRPTPDPRSFIGDGKVAELKEFIEMNNCDLAVFDNELSPSQMRVLGESSESRCSTVRGLSWISSHSARRLARDSFR